MLIANFVSSATSNFLTCMQVNKEEDDKMRATAANVAARAAVGGDDMLSKWQLMAEQARQKREGMDGPSSSQPGKAAISGPSLGIRRNLREQPETQKKGSASTSISGKFIQLLCSFCLHGHTS